MSVIEEIAAERKRQIEVEGWAPEHDDEHATGELSLAATAYVSTVAAGLQTISFTSKPLKVSGYMDIPMPKYWPFAPSWWKPKSLRRDLIRAAALIVAEIERLDRASA